MIQFERAAVFFLLITAAGVTTLARSILTWEVSAVPVLLCVITAYISLVYQVRVSRSFVILIFIYLLLFVAQWAWYGSFHPKHLALYPLNMWIAYAFINSMKERLFFHSEYIITRLAAVGVGIWVADVLSGGVIRALLSGFQVVEPYNATVDSNIVVYTFIHDGAVSLLPRNAGFAWEPGAFAVFCCVALLINLYRKSFRLASNYSALVLFLAILSTQSTTGYIILLAIVASKLWRDTRGSARVAMALVIPLLVGITASIPFMRDKVVDLWNEDVNELAYSAAEEWNQDAPLAAQRFLSLRLDFTDFLNNPWTGYGGRNSEAEIDRTGLNIVSISGVGKIMARFGVLGIAFVAFASVMSSLQMSRYYGSRTPVLMAFLVLMVSISYSLLEHPFFMCFWAYWFFLYSGCSAQTDGLKSPSVGKFISSTENGRP